MRRPTPLLPLALSLFALATAFAGTAPGQEARNSTKTIRPEPSALAAKAGMQVQWRDSVDAALTEAAESGRPVFWYVPTIAGSFMDRKTELDRYMMAGPFSWPRTIELLNEHYVPVRQPANKALNARYGIERIEFIEPGYLVLTPEGEETARLDRITTFHPRWFLTPLERLVGLEPSESDTPFAIRQTPVVDPDSPRIEGPPEGAGFLLGVQAFLRGDDAGGEAFWRSAIERDPSHPLAAKMAMELEGYGPFLRGFEVFGPLPDGALVRGEGSQSAAPYEESVLWTRGVEFLAGLQTDGGGFEDSFYDYGGTDGLPNVHVAVTAVCGVALETARADHERAVTAFDLARRYLLDDANLNVADTDEQIWAHLYRLRFLAACMDGDAEAKAWALAPAQRIATTICEAQTSNGPWAHEYPNPMVTASCLVALADVARHGVTVPEQVVDRGCAALERSRTEAGAYTYYMPRGEARARVEANVGRGPLCELALHLWGRSDQERLLAAVRASFEHEEPFFRVRKYDNHSNIHAFGGFFFWYGLRGRVEAISHLEDAAARTRFAERARQQILALPEFDGCFVDSHEIGRAYGTGMALWCLRVLNAID